MFTPVPTTPLTKYKNILLEKYFIQNTVCFSTFSPVRLVMYSDITFCHAAASQRIFLFNTDPKFLGSCALWQLRFKLKSHHKPLCYKFEGWRVGRPPPPPHPSRRCPSLLIHQPDGSVTKRISVTQCNRNGVNCLFTDCTYMGNKWVHWSWTFCLFFLPAWSLGTLKSVFVSQSYFTRKILKVMWRDWAQQYIEQYA